jgi:hypothetical protein
MRAAGSPAGSGLGSIAVGIGVDSLGTSRARSLEEARGRVKCDVDQFAAGRLRLEVVGQIYYECYIEIIVVEVRVIG